MRSEPPDTLRDNSIPPLYSGEGEIPQGAPLWFQLAIRELRAERAEMVTMLQETLSRVEARDERMMAMLETTLNQALANETRLNRVEERASRNELAIAQLRAELEQMRRTG